MRSPTRPLARLGCMHTGFATFFGVAAMRLRVVI
jgi:hypothetical protein